MKGSVRSLEPWVIADGERIRWRSTGPEAWVAGCLEARREPGALGQRLVVANNGDRPVRLRAAFARWAVASERLRIGCFESRWGCENQLRWIDPVGAGLELRHPAGRTGEGNPTHAFADFGGAWHAWIAVPRGDLVARWVPDGPFLGPHGSPRQLQLWIGPPPEGLDLVVPVHGSVEVAEVLELELAGGLTEAARSLSRACRAAWGPTRECPVVWNTWLDRFDRLEPDRLLRQLEAAVEVGCEGLVVDAGWFGTGTDWWEAVGDWEECRTAAFHGRMADFAERVRSAGLFLGLWMEPERVAANAAVRRSHPGWVTEAGRLRLELPEAFEWLLETASSRIREYGARWLKVDMNFSLGDAAGDAHRAHREALHLWLSALRERFPSLYLEGCSSGAMRLDLDLIPAFDQHFLSDNTNPWDVARIAEGTALRAPLDRIGRWAVLYESDGQLLTPKTAGLEGRETVSVPFAVAPAFLGAFGLSGDLASLGEENRERLARCVSAYRRVRSELVRSELRTVAQPRPRGDRSGWSWQGFLGPSAALLVALRLEDSREERSWPWEELLDGSAVEPEVLFADDGARAEARDDGLAVMLPRPNAAIALRLPSGQAR
ncbi:MAG: alpha-galactosidase [Fimbriimonadales bacterium]|nr:alpha-galactosidase [Fimbriimonadales bacterium]